MYHCRLVPLKTNSYKCNLIPLLTCTTVNSYHCKLEPTYLHAFKWCVNKELCIILSLTLFLALLFQLCILSINNQTVLSVIHAGVSPSIFLAKSTHVTWLSTKENMCQWHKQNLCGHLIYTLQKWYSLSWLCTCVT